MEVILHKGPGLPRSPGHRSQCRRLVQKGLEANQNDVQGWRLPSPPDPYNHTISPEDQQTPSLALKAIQSIIKEDVYFSHHRDEMLSDLHQLPNEGIHALSTCIITLVGKCNFPSQEVKEIMKLMVLQHWSNTMKRGTWSACKIKTPSHTSPS